MGCKIKCWVIVCFQINFKFRSFFNEASQKSVLVKLVSVLSLAQIFRKLQFFILCSPEVVDTSFENPLTLEHAAVRHDEMFRALLS